MLKGIFEDSDDNVYKLYLKAKVWCRIVLNVKMKVKVVLKRIN